MSPINQEPLDIILGHYNIKVLSTKSESYKDKKGVWWVQTPEGYKILKKVSNSESTLKFILSAVEHLTKNGVCIPKVNKTTDNQDYVNINGTCYVLSDAIEGRNPGYSSARELEKIVRGLAIFHKASRGFVPPSDSKPKFHLGLWVEDYQNQISDMEAFYKNELSSQTVDLIGKLVIKEFPGICERARDSIEALQGDDYRQWVIDAKEAVCLCHQDFAAGNLILCPSGELYVLDTDSITFDLPARDIRKLLNKIMKKQGQWDMELTQRILSYYQLENPLTRSQWSVVKYDLMFPHLFIGAMNKYYYRRDSEWTVDKYYQRIKEMSAFEKTIKPVLEHFDTLIPE